MIVIVTIIIVGIKFSPIIILLSSNKAWRLLSSKSDTTLTVFHTSMSYSTKYHFYKHKVKQSNPMSQTAIQSSPREKFNLSET